MYEIKKLDVLSVAKIQTFLTMAGYFVWLVFFGFIQFVSLGRLDDLSDFFGFGTGGFWIIIAALIGGPIVFGVIGFICGAICALIYNLIASWLGGIKMDIILSEKKKEPGSQDQSPTQT